MLYFGQGLDGPLPPECIKKAIEVVNGLGFFDI